jgi:NAD(P)-dependent dehydrogenase (short-subunit alcohol dehydrogenase family)
MKTWLVTGCSSGIGRALAKRVLEQGHRCVVTARDVARAMDLAAPHPDTALALALDVRDPEQRRTVLSQAAARFGAVDVLVNNAGHGYSAAVEEGDEAAIRAMFDTNFFALAALTRDVLPQMRAQRSGHIVNVSSMGGLVGNPASGYYNASKFAVEGLSEALAKEVEPHGIRVTLIEPGPFRTDFQGRSMVTVDQVLEAYTDTAGARRAQVRERHGRQPGDPDRAAAAIMKVVAMDTPPLRLLLGTTAVVNVRAKVTELLRSIDEWEAVSASADYPQAST